LTSGGNNNSFMSDINVTPFVDVMLVLLIIFMVTAPMMTQGVDVALPEATAEPLPAEEENLMIPVTVDDLNEKLKRIMGNRSDREVYLKADKDIPYGTVVRVMSEIKLAGVEKLGMVTVPPTKDEKVNKK
jgi:biopolymer transport protein TolR